MRQAFVSIASDDANDSPYTFAIDGTGADPGASQLVVDDSMAGATVTGSWGTSATSAAYQSEQRTHAGGTSGDSVRWTFNSLAPGVYTVYATWVPNGSAATNAPFTIADGSVPQSTVAVNEQLAPADVSADGAEWKILGTVTVTSGTVVVTLSTNANGTVLADAVRLVHGDQTDVVPLPIVLHNAALRATSTATATCRASMPCW